MRRPTFVAAALLLAGVLIAGCGGGSSPKNASSPPASSAAVSATKTTTASGPHRQTTARLPSPTSAEETTTATMTATSTRTSSKPAFTEEESTTKDLATAVASVKGQGYTPNDTGEYHPSQTLRVLTATKTGSADGYDQRAFFFVDGHYIGTDSSQPSASLKIVSQSDTEVTLAYAMYRPNDSLCCPSGGQATVRFQLNNGRLQALDQIPPASSASGLERH